MPTKLVSWTQKVFFSNEIELTEEEIIQLTKDPYKSLPRKDNMELFDKIDTGKQQDDIDNEMEDIIIE